MNQPVPGNTARILWSHPAAQRTDRRQADVLVARIDIYESSIQLTPFTEGRPGPVRPVSAADMAKAITSNARASTGILPPSILWQSLNPAGPPTSALWVPPHRRHVALTIQHDKPTVRLQIPLPGTIFICSPASAPRVYAAPERPAREDQALYHAPLFNTFRSGLTCAGTQEYDQDVALIPEQFFRSWFTLHGDTNQRSKKHPDSLYQLWTELDGAEEFPCDDLIYWGSVEKAMDL